MKNQTLHISPRVNNSKANRLRHQGYVPGVLYGYNEKTIPVVLDKKQLDNFVQHLGEDALFEIALEGEIKPVRIKEIQRDPVSREVLHIDFQHVFMDRKIRAHVPIRFEGIDSVEKKGVILQHQMNKIEVEGYAKNIPSYVKVPVNNLSPGQSVHVFDLEIGEELSVLDNLNEVIVLAIQPSSELVEEEKKAVLVPANNQVENE